ncbi:T9SS type A sorting domain-containing protein [Ochrovirga pacifica]|uniref:T9SS type A sorting domain-containing protein n=1 Tax=Ochrovirga pacifica TaxID=1042376 RepID=UPI000255A577|nr:T9SS type A sorting domain-containing protein [Ochrovirga pacifica]
MKKITLLASLLFSAAVFSQELLVNGGFENWDSTSEPTGFTKKENVEQESTEKHGGSFSVKHTGGTKDLGQTVSIIGGNYYRISLWYKTAQVGDETDSRIWSYWKNGAATLDANADELRGPENKYFTNNTSSWQYYEVTLQAPAEADNFYFEVRTYKNAITYWDDFSVFDLGNSLSFTNGKIDGLAVSVKGAFIATNKGKIKSIYNVVGKESKNGNLASGIYMVHVVDGDKSEIRKVLIK